MGVLDVCAAVVIRRGRMLLATRRPGSRNAGLWEFPGGKVATGESLGECIAREIVEELAYGVSCEGEIDTLVQERPSEDTELRLHFLACRGEECSEPVPQEGQQCGWFSPAEWSSLEMAPLDRQFLLKHSAELAEKCSN